MAKERRIIFDLGEVVAVRLRCRSEKCTEETVLRLDRQRTLPMKCPLCNEPWASFPNNRRHSPELDWIYQTQRVIGNSGAVDILLELNDDTP